MDDDAENSEEGEQGEASQQSKLQLHGFSISKAYSEEVHPMVFHF